MPANQNVDTIKLSLVKIAYDQQTACRKNFPREKHRMQ